MSGGRRRDHRVGVALDAASRGPPQRSSSVTTSPPERPRSLEARARRPALPPAGRDASGLRGVARTPTATAERTPPRVGAAVHDPDPHPGWRRVPQDRPCSGLGDVDVRPHGGMPPRQGPPPTLGGQGPRADAHHAHASGSLVPTSTTTPRRRCPPDASRWRERPPSTAPSWSTSARSRVSVAAG